MSQIHIQPTPIEGLFLGESSAFEDARGTFVRYFCQNSIADVLGDRRIVQVNCSITHAVGAVRGLHFQWPPHAETKLVRCQRGRIFDVAVDLRTGSKTYRQWFGVELTPENRRMLVVPEGFAHGFQVLAESSEVLYFTTAGYSPDYEDGIVHDDPAIGVEWPLTPTDLSDRDRRHPLLYERPEACRSIPSKPKASGQVE